MPPEHTPPEPPSQVSPPVAELLRRLWLNDERTVRAALSGAPTSAPTLDRKTEALVQLAGFLACGGPTTACRVAVENARSARASDEEIVSVLVAIAPALGAARLIATVPPLALAIDYDLEQDEE